MRSSSDSPLSTYRFTTGISKTFQLFRLAMPRFILISADTVNTMIKTFLFFFLLLLVTSITFSQVYRKTEPLSHTFSIVARDATTGELGVAVQSHWFSVGTAVSWAEAGVGAVATQSFTNKSFGPRGLQLLRAGLTAKQALDSLLATDEGREVRQVAIVDRNGSVAVHTGKACIDEAGHYTGDGYSVQANMMLTGKVPAAMSSAFEKSSGKPLAERLLLSLEAAQAAGGDIRGKQSAALLIVPGKSNNEPWNERTVDLRVDDAAVPLKELRRLYNVHTAYQHMNNGDEAVEKSNMPGAMKYYGAAMKLFPQNLEMRYWTAITLANNKEVPKALPMLKSIFAKDPNWKELTRRLPKVGLLAVSEKDLEKILRL
jgi:uncharacterized Ntn-hydrolase superfamily protein